MKKILLLLSFAALTSLNSRAQATVDITLVHTDNNTLDVRVRPNAYFDGVFSSLVFTLRWESGSSIALAPATASDNAPIAINRSGQAHTDGAYRYQVFAGFSFSSLSENGQHWDAGTEYTVLSIPFTGSGDVELVNDGWTNTRNGDYYVSLNGVDQTGVIYSEATTGVSEGTSTDAAGLIAWPNPATDVINYTVPASVDGTVDIIDAAGRVVRSERPNTRTGRCDLAGFAPGTYTLRVTNAHTVYTFPFDKL